MKSKLLLSLVATSLLLVACGKEEIAPGPDQNTNTEQVAQQNSGSYVNPVTDISSENTAAQNADQNNSPSNGTFFELAGESGGVSFSTNGSNAQSTDDHLTAEQQALLAEIESLAAESAAKQQVQSNNGLSTNLTNEVLGNINNANSTQSELSLTEQSQKILQDKMKELTGGSGSYEVGTGMNTNKNAPTLNTEGDQEVEEKSYPESTLDFSIVNEVQAPSSLKTWMASYKTKQGITSKELDEYYYILFAAGPQSSTGYEINILGAYKGDPTANKKGELHFELNYNKKGSISMTTYPTLLVRIKKADVYNTDVQFFGGFEPVEI